MSKPQALHRHLVDTIMSDPWRGATIVCILMFSAFSLALSTVTLSALFDMRYAPLIAFLVMLAVQTFATVNAVSLFQPFSRLDAVVALIGWLFLTTLSVVTNWGVWFNWLSAKDYARAVYNEDAQEISDLAMLIAARYERIASDATELSDHSKAMAEIEDTRGGTCRDGAGRTQGPRWQLRTNDAATFAVVAQHFSGQAASARTTAASLGEALRRYGQVGFAQSAKDINTHYAALRALGADPEIERVPAMLEQRIELGKNGWSASGEWIRCPDAELEALANRLAGALDLPAMPERPILFEPTMKNSIRLAYSDMLGGLFGALQGLSLAPAQRDELIHERKRELAGSDAPTPADVLKASPWLWFFAALPDLMVLLAAWRLSMRNRSGDDYVGPVSRPFQRLAAWRSWSVGHAVKNIAFTADGIEYDARRILEVLIPWMGLTPRLMSRRKGAVTDVYVPLAGQDKESQEIIWVMTVLEALQAAALINPAAVVSSLPVPVQARLAPHNIEIAAHYELDRGFYEDLVIQALGTDSERRMPTTIARLIEGRAGRSKQFAS